MARTTLVRKTADRPAAGSEPLKPHRDVVDASSTETAHTASSAGTSRSQRRR